MATRNETPDAKDNISSVYEKHQRWLLATIAALLPFIPILNLYSQNAIYISFWQSLLVCTFLGIGIFVLFWLVDLSCNNPTVAYLSCILATILFFLYPIPSAWFQDLSARHYLTLFLNLLFFVGAVFLLSKTLRDKKNVCTFLALGLGLFVVLLFVMSLFSVYRNSVPVWDIVRRHLVGGSYLAGMDLVVLASLFLFFAFVFYRMVARVTKSCLIARVVLLLASLLFWIFPLLQSRIHQAHALLWGCVAVVSCVLVGLSLYQRTKPRNQKNVSFSLSITIFVSLLVVQIAALVLYIDFQKPNEYVKTEFVVDNQLPAPNIYWLHCDSMMSFASIEKYFGDSQIEAQQALEERGFVINRDAQFEAEHTTQVALPVLMNPAYYDSSLFYELLDASKVQRENGTRVWNNVKEHLVNVRAHNELVNAFNADKDYTTFILSEDVFLGMLTFLQSDYYYVFDTKVVHRSLPQRTSFVRSCEQLRELIRLLKQISAVQACSEGLINLVDAYEKGRLSSTNYGSPVSDLESKPNPQASDTLRLTEPFNLIHQLEGPRFVLVMTRVAHRPFIFDENGAPHDNDVEAVSSYLPQHKFAMKDALALIDNILAMDPDAVIVMQGDHGIHGIYNASDMLAQLGDAYSSYEDVLAIWNSSVSAVRIPPKYGTLTEPLNPLNITRYLVNHFVGENYAYLDPSQSDLY